MQIVHAMQFAFNALQILKIFQTLQIVQIVHAMQLAFNTLQMLQNFPILQIMQLAYIQAAFAL